VRHRADQAGPADHRGSHRVEQRLGATAARLEDRTRQVSVTAEGRELDDLVAIDVGEADLRGHPPGVEHGGAVGVVRRSARRG
jgi:hypothetical protein